MDLLDDIYGHLWTHLMLKGRSIQWLLCGVQHPPSPHIYDLIIWVCNHKNCENFFVMLEQWGWKRMYTFVRNTICVCDCVWILFISPFLQWNINKLLEIILSRWSFLLTSIQYVNWSNLIVIKRVSFNHKKSCFILKCLIMVKRF